jgi:hypothetical protein
LGELVKHVLSWSEDEDPRVEYVGPTDVRHCRELMGDGEEVRNGTKNKNVGVKKDDFGELSETKNL